MDRLKTESISSLFFKYLIPSVTGTLSVGILIFIDTVFIGRGLGTKGLAALNTALPAFTFYSSTGLLLGMGGATAAAIDSGRGNSRGKNRIFSQSLLLAVGTGLIFTLLQVVFLDRIIYLLGATDSLFAFTKQYLGTISIFTIFYLVPHTLSAFIRNDNNPNLAMIGMVVCGLINIVLDYIFIFIFNWEMRGAALATGLSQVGYFLILMCHFLSPKNTLKVKVSSLHLPTIRRVIKIGFPSFLNDTSMGIAIFAFNLVLFRIRGDIGVSAYSIILNINFLIYLIFVGIAQACQPLISINYGSGSYQRVKEALRLGLISSGTVALFTMGFLYIFRYPVVKLFNSESPLLIEVAAKGMPIFFSGTLFMGINVILSMLFQSIENSTISSLLTFLRGLGLLIAGLIFLPKLLGIEGVWLTPIFAESLTLLLGIYLYRKARARF